MSGSCFELQERYCTCSAHEDTVSVKEEQGMASENEKIVPFLEKATAVVETLEGDLQRSRASGCHRKGD